MPYDPNDPNQALRDRVARAFANAIKNNPAGAGGYMQQLKDAGLDINGNRITPAAAQPPAAPPPTVQPPGLTAADRAIPFGGTGGAPNSLAAIANRGDPSQAPDFRSRLNAAMDTAGVQLPGPSFSTQRVRPDLSGYLHGDTSQLGFPAAPPSFTGNPPRTRPPEQLSAAGPPSPLTGASPPSPLAGAGPPAPIIGREAPPGLNGPPSPLASRFGDQSQLPGGAFSGSFPRPPQPRPFESMIAARPEGPPSGFPPAAGPPAPTSVATQGGFKPAPGFDQPLRSVPPSASLPPLSPAAMDARVGAVSPETTLPPSAMDARVGVTTPSAALGPLQRAPLNLAAGAGMSGPPPPLGSMNMPFAANAPFGSVGQRMTDAGLPPGPRPVRSAETPLMSVPPAAAVPPVGAVTSQPLPAPDALSSIPPASMQALSAYTGTEDPTVSQTAPSVPSPPRQEIPTAPRLPTNISANEAEKRARERGFGSLENSSRDRWGRGIGAMAGAIVGLGSGNPLRAAVLGVAGYRKGDDALRTIGNFLNRKKHTDEERAVISQIKKEMAGPGLGEKMGGMWGGSGDSMASGGRGMGGGGGSSYSGGNYGGYGGNRITEGIGGAYRNR